MKKLSLFGLVGLTGLLAFVATPLYAQEEDVILNDEEIVADVEDIVADVEDTVADVEDAVAADVEDVVADVEDVVADVEDAIVADEDENALETVEDEDTVEGETDLDDSEYAYNEENFDDVLSMLDDGQKQALGLAGLFGLLAGFGLAGGLISLIFAVLIIIALWKAFEKAGEAGWKALIPVYNLYIMFKIAGMKNWFWYSLIAMILCAVIAAIVPNYESLLTKISSAFCGIVGIVTSFKFARKYGWGVFASILFVLFSGICILILGFGNYKYQGEEKTVVEA